jgi:DNA-binding NtrC family response regulator
MPPTPQLALRREMARLKRQLATVSDAVRRIEAVLDESERQMRAASRGAKGGRLLRGWREAVDEFKRALILYRLREFSGNRAAAARSFGLAKTNFYRAIKDLGLTDAVGVGRMRGGRKPAKRTRR